MKLKETILILLGLVIALESWRVEISEAPTPSYYTISLSKVLQTN